MKKLIPILLLTFFFIQPAEAATPVVRITDVAHTDINGTFIDNELEESLLVDGKLGKLVFGNRSQVTWVIDAALIDEITDMSDGYEFEKEETSFGQLNAQLWLAQLRSVTSGNPIVALPYGNSDSSLVRNISKKELDFYSDAAAAKLEAFFGRPVISQNGWGIGRSHPSSDQKARYKANRLLLTNLSKVVADPELSQLRLNISKSLNPLLNSKQRTFLFDQSDEVTKKAVKKLSIVTGRYQLTSKNVKVPVTLINNFDTSVVVNLSLTPLNFRVHVDDIENIELPPRSHIQLSVPFTVIAPGSTVVKAQFVTESGVKIGEVSPLNLSLTVIDSRVAWFTTAAAIALFLGAVVQSVRRIRRRGSHEK